MLAAQQGTGLVGEFEVAHLTGMSIGTVRRWRLRKQGPRFIKIGAAVRYRTADVEKWIKSRPTGGEMKVSR